MSQPHAGSVRRARERMQQGNLKDRSYPHQRRAEGMQDAPVGGLRPPPFRAAAGPGSAPLKTYNQETTQASRGTPAQQSTAPTNVPEWPLAGSLESPAKPSGEQAYRLPPGRAQQPPQRPPRPSVVPSIVDQSRLQGHTPVFFNRADIEDDDESDYMSPTNESRWTNSSVGTIPEFPDPAHTPNAAVLPLPRRSANLGPPPSSRRGASSFYSRVSHVSPIPEESPRSRSHLSAASSGVIPGDGRLDSPLSAYDDVYYDDALTDKSRDSPLEEFGDESKLVRSASLGKKGRPSLIVTRGPGMSSKTPPTESANRFAGGTALRDESSASVPSTESNGPSPPATNDPRGGLVSPEAMLGAYAAASGSADDLRKLTPSPKPPSRLSAMRRPPRLDINAVREMEARGSTTSLTDLIKRATRLASMMDRGKRPASRFDSLNDYLDRSGGSRDGEKPGMDEKHQSGFSDMLAAFPPPAQDARTRGSWFNRSSWPLAPGRPGQQPGDGEKAADDEAAPKKKQGRRCCGMPRWLFILILFICFCVVAAAIVLPLQFFVFKTIGPQAEPQSILEQCRSTLTCENGGVNVVVANECSCICTSGFTGNRCEVGGERGCTTTNLVSSNGETTVANVTLGRAVPRIVAHSEDNFSVPLSGTAILARFSNAELSCIAQNSLVTFNGRALRVGASGAGDIGTISATQPEASDLALEGTDDDAFEEVSALTEPAAMITEAPRLVRRDEDAEQQTTEEKLVLDTSAVAELSKTLSSKQPEATKAAGEGFQLTEDVLDFARVAVLFVLQEKSLRDAEDAQGVIQDFLTKFKDQDDDNGATKQKSVKLKVGDDTTIDLVNFTIQVKERTVGVGTGETEGSRKRDLPLAPNRLARTHHGHRGSRLRRFNL